MLVAIVLSDCLRPKCRESTSRKWLPQGNRRDALYFILERGNVERMKSILTDVAGGLTFVDPNHKEGD